MPDNSPSQPTEPTNSANQPTAKHPPGNNVGLLQAYLLRNLAAEQALQLKECPANTVQELAARAQALRNSTAVWETACERIRIIRGRPLPGSLKPEAKSKHKVRKPIEPQELP